MDIGLGGGGSQLRGVEFEDASVTAVYRTPSSNDFLYKYKLMNANEYEFDVITFKNRKKELEKEVKLYQNDVSFNYESVDDLSLQAIENVLLARGWEGDTVESEPVDDAPALVIPLIDTVEEFTDMKEYFSFLEICQEYATTHDKPVVLTTMEELPYINYCESYIDVVLDFEFRLESGVDKEFILNIAKNRFGSTNDEVLTLEITDRIKYDTSRNV